MIKYKIDILQELKKKGYNTTRIREERLLSQATLTNIRNGGQITTATLDTLCSLLRCQPGKILEWTPDPSPDQDEKTT